MLPDLKVWLNHFEYHALHRRPVPEGLPDVLTAEEKRRIAKSIATFQLGEQSEGRTLLRAAMRFAKQHDAAPLVRITELFIREEQHHADLLLGFMKDHGIPQRQRDWTDHVFRQVRKLAGYELMTSVLISAELIGNVYYRALEVATGCRRLQVLCRMLVSDELAHVGFESEMLHAIRAKRPAPLRVATQMAHRFFFLSAACVVWFTHRPVLRAAGYRLSSFLRACDAQFGFYLLPAVLKTQVEDDFNVGVTGVEPKVSAGS
jgi:hypothetical protein